MLWLLPGELMVISFPIFEGVGVAAGVVLGLGFGVGVGGVGVGVAGFGVGVGVGGVGVGVEASALEVSALASAWHGANAILKSAGRASRLGPQAHQPTEAQTTARLHRKDGPANQTFRSSLFPPIGKIFRRRTHPSAAAPRWFFPARLPPTAGSRRSYMRDGHVSEEDRIATGRASWPPALRRQVRKIPPPRILPSHNAAR